MTRILQKGAVQSHSKQQPSRLPEKIHNPAFQIGKLSPRLFRLFRRSRR
jgi:hypothetical protein